MKDAVFFESLTKEEQKKFREQLTRAVNALKYPVTYVIEVKETVVYFTIKVEGKEFNPLDVNNYVDHESEIQGYGLKILRDLVDTDDFELLSYAYSDGYNIITVKLSNSRTGAEEDKVYSKDTKYIINIPFNSKHFHILSSFYDVAGAPDELRLLEDTYEYLDFKDFFSEIILNYIMYSREESP